MDAQPPTPFILLEQVILHDLIEIARSGLQTGTGLD
jgi:hypothetical protein